MRDYPPKLHKLKDIRYRYMRDYPPKLHKLK